MWINRQITIEIEELSKFYPVIMITGPRQSGKTSLAKKLFSKYDYYSLENPDTRSIIKEDPKSLLSKIKEGVIIDEFQRYPELLSYIQGIVDEEQKPAQFILTGSSNMKMLSSISQSLAGRVGIVKLLPLSISEIDRAKLSFTTDELLLKGFYPKIVSTKINPNTAYRNYFETYIERDIRQVINIKDISSFQKFVQLCAGRTGQIFNANNLANEVGISSVTIKSWINALQASYIVFLLQPWYSNIKKRLIKSPKIYFYDVGLVNYLLGISSIKHIENHPLRGAIFENLVVVDLIKNRFNSGKDNNLYFYRDNHGYEIDIVSQNALNNDIYEIKSSQTFHNSFIKNLEYFKKISKNEVRNSYLVYSGEENFNFKNHKVINYKNLT